MPEFVRLVCGRLNWMDRAGCSRRTSGIWQSQDTVQQCVYPEEEHTSACSLHISAGLQILARMHDVTRIRPERTGYLSLPWCTRTPHCEPRSAALRVAVSDHTCCRALSLAGSVLRDHRSRLAHKCSKHSVYCRWHRRRALPGSSGLKAVARSGCAQASLERDTVRCCQSTGTHACTARGLTS
jgi:hypothetical protein